MKKGDKIIWDSGFGYEIGYFIKDSSYNTYHSYQVNLITGIIEGKCMFSQSEIHLYTEEKQLEMKNKYRYDKKFNEYKDCSSCDGLGSVDFKECTDGRVIIKELEK